mmetsp:Transcript_69730/g.105359  ORF Transcript_69730/g.105359 Transcript_69730/m.105359 type:complete len:266 (+) Transcript_69730:800-1597(+)
MVWIDPLNFFRQHCSHFQPRLIDRDSIHDRVRSSEVNILKNTRGQAGGRVAHTSMQFVRLHIDENSFTSLNVSKQFETKRIHGDRLARHTIIKLGSRLLQRIRIEFFRRVVGTAAEHQWTNPMRIPKRDESNPVDIVHGGISSPATLHNFRAGRKDRLYHIGLFGLFQCQRFGKHVEQKLGIRIGVDVSLFLCHVCVELVRIRKVAIVSDDNAVGVVRVEGLGLRTRACSGRGVSNVAKSDVAPEFQHVVLLEHVAHQAVVLPEV